MIPSEILTIIYNRPTFFSLNYWLFPMAFMLGITAIFVAPVIAGSIMNQGVSFDDVVILGFLGLLVGGMFDVIAQMFPYYVLVIILIPLFIYMLR